MNEIDALIAGFCGGVIGAVCVFCCGYYYIRRMTNQYNSVKIEFKNYLLNKNIAADVFELRKDVNEIFEELNKKESPNIIRCKTSRR